MYTITNFSSLTYKNKNVQFTPGSLDLVSRWRGELSHFYKIETKNSSLCEKFQLQNIY